MSVVVIDDVDDHHARTNAAGADIVEKPTDQPYGVREYGIRDPGATFGTSTRR
jgi:MerR family transcriptional regulator, thiopeptide resistance regulator